MMIRQPIPRDENGKLKINGVLKLVELESKDFDKDFIKLIEEKEPLSPNDFNIYAYPELMYKVNEEVSDDIIAYEDETQNEYQKDIVNNDLDGHEDNMDESIDPIFVDSGVHSEEFINNLHQEIDKHAKQQFESYNNSTSNDLSNVINALKTQKSNMIVDDEKMVIKQQLDNNSSIINNIASSEVKNYKRVESVEHIDNSQPKSVADLIVLTANKRMDVKPTNNYHFDLIDNNDVKFINNTIDLSNQLPNQPKSVLDLIDFSNTPFIYDQPKVEVIEARNTQNDNNELKPKFVVPLSNNSSYYNQVLDEVNKIQPEVNLNEEFYNSFVEFNKKNN